MAARGFGTDPAGLAKALEEGQEVAIRAEAAFLLGYLHAASAAPALKKALTDESARVRVEAALALARLSDRKIAFAVLERELNGQFFADAPLRAARALAVLGDPRGYPRVVEALDSEFPSNRMEAVAVLPAFLPYQGRTVAGTPINPLDQLLRAARDTEPLLRRDALTALATIDDQRATAAVAAAAAADPDEQVREFAQQL
ncbi:MAG: HEAT repeat domain-containing protein, partial [Candidatus Dormibacter sp.]